jgi:hypothetical protein
MYVPERDFEPDEPFLSLSYSYRRRPVGLAAILLALHIFLLGWILMRLPPFSQDMFTGSSEFGFIGP